MNTISRRKTHDEYVKELAEKNPNLEPLAQYIDAKTKILHRCKTHNITFEKSPSCALNGSGCELCRTDKIRQCRMLSNNEYINKLHASHSHIHVLDEYQGMNIPIIHKCLIHNITWKIAPSNMLSVIGCSECTKDSYRSKMMKTTDQYKIELRNINHNIIPLECYKGADTSILHKCLVHNYEWMAQPNNLLSGQSTCPKCSQRFRRTNNDYINELAIKYPNIIALEDFQGMLIPIKHKCTKHNISWSSTPDNILRGHGCKKCGAEKSKEKSTKTNAQYIQELSKINSKIIPLELYNGASNPIKHKCLIDDFTWDIAPANLLSGRGCPKCNNHILRTPLEYKKELQTKNPNIIPLEDYIGASTNILHKCLIHNVEWKVRPYSVLNGVGCPLCAKEKIAKANVKSHCQYVQDLLKSNIHVRPIENYINTTTPILHECMKHHYLWKVAPTRILQGYGCPKCNASKGELCISSFLELHNIKYETQKRFPDCKDQKSLPFDFYLCDLNKCIEFDGGQHFQPVEFFGGVDRLKYQQYHDKLKDEYCQKNGIPLLRIPYYKNIEEELNNFLFN